jgi:hypothetical protein
VSSGLSIWDRYLDKARDEAWVRIEKEARAEEPVPPEADENARVAQIGGMRAGELRRTSGKVG